ncbi:hypothetical protein GCM10023238_07170 [Streptomyces heliomycini]
MSNTITQNKLPNITKNKTQKKIIKKKPTPTNKKKQQNTYNPKTPLTNPPTQKHKTTKHNKTPKKLTKQKNKTYILYIYMCVHKTQPTTPKTKTPNKTNITLYISFSLSLKQKPQTKQPQYNTKIKQNPPHTKTNKNTPTTQNKQPPQKTQHTTTQPYSL